MDIVSCSQRDEEQSVRKRGVFPVFFIVSRPLAHFPKSPSLYSAFLFFLSSSWKKDAYLFFMATQHTATKKLSLQSV